MEGVLALIEQYGLLVYLLLFGYCALKSGWLPLFAGYAAHTGALYVGFVALVTFMGGYLVDYLKQPVSLLNAMAQPTFFISLS